MLRPPGTVWARSTRAVTSRSPAKGFPTVSAPRWQAGLARGLRRDQLQRLVRRSPRRGLILGRVIDLLPFRRQGPVALYKADLAPSGCSPTMRSMAAAPQIPARFCASTSTASHVVGTGIRLCFQFKTAGGLDRRAVVRMHAVSRGSFNISHPRPVGISPSGRGARALWGCSRSRQAGPRPDPAASPAVRPRRPSTLSGPPHRRPTGQRARGIRDSSSNR